MCRVAAEHRVDAARRAQRGLLTIGPDLDRGRREAAEAEEASALTARLDLCAVLRRVLVCVDEEQRQRRGCRCGCDHQSSSYHACACFPTTIACRSDLCVL